MNEQHDVIVQINTLGSHLKLVALNVLSEGFENDQEFSQLDKPLMNKIFVTLYVLTGCDFTSFFVGITKIKYYLIILNLLPVIPSLHQAH